MNKKRRTAIKEYKGFISMFNCLLVSVIFNALVFSQNTHNTEFSIKESEPYIRNDTLLLLQTDNNKCVISGRVIDELGEPVIGATIFCRTENSGIISGIDGKFELEVNCNAELEVAFLGYNNYYITVENNMPDITIVLKEDTQLIDFPGFCDSKHIDFGYFADINHMPYGITATYYTNDVLNSRKDITYKYYLKSDMDNQYEMNFSIIGKELLSYSFFDIAAGIEFHRKAVKRNGEEYFGSDFQFLISQKIYENINLSIGGGLRKYKETFNDSYLASVGGYGLIPGTGINFSMRYIYLKQEKEYEIFLNKKLPTFDFLHINLIPGCGYRYLDGNNEFVVSLKLHFQEIIVVI